MTSDPSTPALPRETALVDSVVLNESGTGLVVRGSVVHRDAFSWESTTQAFLVVQGTGKRFEAHFEPVGAPQLNMRREWSAEVNLARIPRGTHRLRLEFRSPSAKQRIRTRPSRGMERSSRSLRERGGLVQIRPGPKRSVVLCRQTGRRRLWQIRWHLQRLRADLRDLRAGEPFALHRLIRTGTRPLMRNRVALLITERGDTAQDNGFALFSWIRLNHPDFAAYYVVTDDGEAWQRVSPLGNVIAHGSLKHRFFMLHARVLASSHDIDAYLLPPQWNRVAYRRRLAHRVEARRVFLQHGVIHNAVGPRLHRRITGLDAFVCSSPRELEYLLQSSGYAEELTCTGLPRFDTLVRSTVDRRIYVMPTWRVYLTHPSYRQGEGNGIDSFTGSPYQVFWSEFLNNPRLAEELRQSGSMIEFAPHSEMAAHFKADASANVVVTLDGGHNLQQSLRAASLFVSDFSSVVFDAAYLGIPVIHVPFDEDEFYGQHYERGWFEFRRDGFGPVATTVDQLVDTIIGYIRSDFVREPAYDDRVTDLFCHTDQSNCERNFELVRSLAASPHEQAVQLAPPGSTSLAR